MQKRDWQKRILWPIEAARKVNKPNLTVKNESLPGCVGYGVTIDDADAEGTCVVVRNRVCDRL